MAKITLGGNPIETSGQLPEIGSVAKDFKLVAADLKEITLKDYQGKRVILNIFPSIDTPTCAMSVRRFNEEAGNLKNTVVLCVSADLPFAGARFCGAEGLENVITGSTFRCSEFGMNYGLDIVNGPLQGLLSRVIVIIDEQGKVIYTQQVPEIGDEPNYEKALAVL